MDTRPKGTIQTNHKKSMINGLRVVVVRDSSGENWLEVRVIKSYKHYSRGDELTVEKRFFIPDSR